MRAKTIGWMLTAAVLAAGCAAQEARPLAWPPRAVSPQDVAAFDEVQALVAAQRYEDAAARLPAVVSAFEAAGDRARTAGALFWMAYCEEKQGRGNDAARLYEDVVRRYADTQAARMAAERLALLRGPRP